MDEDDLGGSAPQFQGVQVLHSWDPSGSDGQYSSGSTVGNKTECVLITHIRATNLALRLRRIPVGFYVVIKTENGTRRTSNKSASVSTDVIEWDEVVLLSDGSSGVALTVFASFELEPTLGSGEALCEYETTINELLDCDGQPTFIELVGKNDREVNPPSTLEIQTGRRVHGESEYIITSKLPESEEMCQLEELTDEGHQALIRYRELEDEQDLDESIRYFEHARDLCPLGHPSRASVLFNLATAKLIYCRVNYVPSYLDASINLYRDALRLRPCGHPDHTFTLLSLGIALEARFQRQFDAADGEEGESHLSRVLDIASTDSYAYHAAVLALGSAVTPKLIEPAVISEVIEDLDDEDEDGEARRLDAVLQWLFRPESLEDVSLDHLGILVCIPIDSLGDVGDPEKTISMLEAVIPFISDTHPNKPSLLEDLVDSLSTRYGRFEDVADLQKLISLQEDALQLTPDEHPNQPSLLSGLGISLSTRYERFGDATDLEKSVSLLEGAVELTPDEHPMQCLRLTYLANILSARYKNSGDATDLERSISLKETVIQLTPDEHPNMPSWLNNLSDSLSIRYMLLGNVTDLESSISLMEDVVRLTLDGHPDEPLYLNNLGNLLSVRYRDFGDVGDLERSISVLESVVPFTSDGYPGKPLWLNNLGNALSLRYENFGDVTDLERSIILFENAVELTPDGKPSKPSSLNNLANSLHTRYTHLGDVADLKRSISIFEDVVRLSPDEHPNKPMYLNNLGNLLSTRYKRFGDISDLEISISTFKDMVRLTPDGHPDKPWGLHNISNMLSVRYERFGDLADLEGSIVMSEDAVRLTPDGHSKKPLWLSMLGHSLSIRYERFGDVADLERSISLAEDAVKFTSDGHPDKPAWFNNLADSLFARYRIFGDVTDLERSISIKEDVVQLTPSGHPNRPLFLNNLGVSLSTRYKRFGNVDDLERSISMMEEAVKFTPDGHPNKDTWLHELAFSLFRRFQRSGDASCPDLSRAISYSARTARSSTGPSLHRLEASQIWIHCVRLLGNDSQSLLDAYTVVVDLLPQLAWMGLSFQDRYHRLLQAAEGARDAAAAALEVHRPDLAVEWLEQGRSVVWGQLSQLRTPVDDLRTINPELASRFEHVSRELERAGARDRVIDVASTSHLNAQDSVLERQAQQHHALALSREQLLAEIHALPGFERFLLPKTIKQLSSLAHSGSVIFLNASVHRCDALVVKDGSDNVVHVPLPNTNYDEVAGLQRRLNKLLRVNGRTVLRDESDRGARVKRMSLDDTFRTILPYLWERVVNPILEVLSLSTLDDRLPRIFWCPTGPFSFLPIHAAGIYDTANRGPKLSDFAISSYIPTMSALDQKDSKAPSPNIRLLAIPQPSTDGQAHLSGVRGEIEAISKLASSSQFVTFQKADGTVEDVLSKMAETDWVHFACHGMQDRSDPYDSGFLLAHGTRLKLSDIARVATRPHRGLAFLSACHTATGDEQLSEEAIHIAAGMLLAGYRCVVATMWSIMDNDAPRVTEDVYETLFGDGRIPDYKQAAEALHHAIGRLRDSGASFLSWVPFIHVGL